MRAAGLEMSGKAFSFACLQMQFFVFFSFLFFSKKGLLSLVRWIQITVLLLPVLGKYGVGRLHGWGLA